MPTLRAYAISALIADTRTVADASYLEGRCKARNDQIFLDRCRAHVPGLVTIQVEVSNSSTPDVTYTFVATRYVFSWKRNYRGKGEYSIGCFEDGGPEWYVEGMRRWIPLPHALGCPVTMEMHDKIRVLIAMRDKL